MPATVRATVVSTAALIAGATISGLAYLADDCNNLLALISLVFTAGAVALLLRAQSTGRTRALQVLLAVLGIGWCQLVFYSVAFSTFTC